MLSNAEIAAYQAPETLLAGRVILVTGAGDGIGKTAALHCAKHGATVILAGRTVAKLEQVYDSIVAEGGAEPVIYPIDLEGASSDDYNSFSATSWTSSLAVSTGCCTTPVFLASAPP